MGFFDLFRRPDINAGVEKQPAHSRVFKHELAGRKHFY